MNKLFFNKPKLYLHNLLVSLFGIPTKTIFLLLSTILTLLLYGACSRASTNEAPSPPPPAPKPQTYAVTFNTNGGSEVLSQEVNSGDTVARPENPTKANSVFGNWFTDEALTKIYSFSTLVTSDLTLYAKWIPEYATTYQVVFNTNGGNSSLETQPIEEDETANKPSNPTRWGYAFEGWYTNSQFNDEYHFNTPVTENITIHAKWIRRFTVTFDFNTNIAGITRTGANETDQVTLIPVDSNTAIAQNQRPTDPTLDGYNFVHWYSDPNAPSVAYDFGTKVTTNITLYANWVKIKTFTVTFNMNGGIAVASKTTAIGSKTIDSGKVVAKPTDPTNEKHGGTFEAWYSNEELTTEYDFSAPVAQDLRLYAKWEYMVTYNVDTRAITGLVGGNDIANGTVDLVIPSNVNGVLMETIQSNAFQENTRIVSLRIAEGIKYIGRGAFSNCGGFTGSLTIPNSVVTIGDGAFSNCRRFSGSLTLGNSLVTIGLEAFANCSGFTGDLTIPNSVVTIGDGAFSNCRRFSGSLTLGNSLVTIGLEAFANCSSFTGSLTVPKSVVTIGDEAFFRMTGVDTFIFKRSASPRMADPFGSWFPKIVIVPNAEATDTYATALGLSASSSRRNRIRVAQ